MSVEQKEKYLGDGLYAKFDGYMIELRTENSNVVYLEPEVYRLLKIFAEECGVQ